MSNFNSNDDYYAILGIRKDSDQNIIKRSYRKLAAKWHPDRFQGENEKKDAEEKFKKLGEAYSVLSNEEKRRTYDQFGKEGLKGGVPGGFSFGNASDLFQMFFEQEGESPFNGLFGKAKGNIPGGMRFTFDGNRRGPQMSNFFNSFQNVSSFDKPQSFIKSPLPYGSKVVLHNLSTHQYNNIQGSVKNFDGNRFIVDVSKASVNKDEIAVKANCISQILNNIKTHSLNSSELNDQIVKSFGYQTGYNRLCCKFKDGIKRFVRPNNLIFPNGTIVRLHNLNKNRIVNNQWGKIIGWLLEKKRYEIKLKNYEKIYKLKPENVLI